MVFNAVLGALPLDLRDTEGNLGTGILNAHIIHATTHNANTTIIALIANGFSPKIRWSTHNIGRPIYPPYS